MREAIQEAAMGRDSAATVALETAVTQRLATRPVEPPPRVRETAPPPPPPPPTRVRRPEPARRPAAPPAEARRRRGAFSRFVALLFLFLLIAAIVAAVVVLNSDSPQSQEFERVARDTINEQVDGLRALIDDATR
jgi:hypothetical protein